MRKVLCLTITIMYLASLISPKSSVLAEENHGTKTETLPTVLIIDADSPTYESDDATLDSEDNIDEIGDELISDLDGLGANELEDNESMTPEMEEAIQKAVDETVRVIEEENEELEEQSQVSVMRASSTSTGTIVKGYFRKNLKLANSINAQYKKMTKGLKPNAPGEAYRAGMWVSLVKSGGAWDLKQRKYLGTSAKYTFRGKLKNGEYIGNFHYGYMGKAVGYSDTVLKSAAGAYQIKSRTSSVKFWKSYFDDPSDTSAIKDGISSYKNGVRF
ncbi:polymorphic toxin type 44 domain-containing protein [Terribacillus sp. JSM ZJ617]|uniref:polymorphic toxin type 44 domain-containing protein n=1 Tax=Terribacillus sp. JSM ZJ617 TaxID=3342119 RepID=UPI0035A8F947